MSLLHKKIVIPYHRIGYIQWEDNSFMRLSSIPRYHYKHSILSRNCLRPVVYSTIFSEATIRFIFNFQTPTLFLRVVRCVSSFSSLFFSLFFFFFCKSRQEEDKGSLLRCARNENVRDTCPIIRYSRMYTCQMHFCDNRGTRIFRKLVKNVILNERWIIDAVW